MSQQLINTDVGISARPHKQLDDTGETVGTKYSIVIECAGRVFTAPSFFASEDHIKTELEKVKSSLRNAVVNVEF